MSMDRKLGFDYATLDGGVLAEDEDSIVFKAVIAREIVHPYPEGRAYKPADELEKAAWTAEGRWVTTGKHPDAQLILRREDIKGRVENPRFAKDLIDVKTKRPMCRGIRADLRLYKRLVPSALIDELRGGAKKDVSIGFLYDEDKTAGEWGGEPYDFVQRNIFIDHVAAAVPVGRCPSPYCGIGVDELGKMKDMERKLGGDPWETTEEYIRSGHRSPDVFDAESLRTISITEGIKAVVGCPQTNAKVVVKSKVDCPICDEIARLGSLEFSTRLVKTFGRDTLLSAVKDQEEPSEKDAFIKACVAEGGSVEDCEAKWQRQEREGETPKETTAADMVDIVERSRRLLQYLK